MEALFLAVGQVTDPLRLCLFNLLHSYGLAKRSFGLVGASRYWLKRCLTASERVRRFHACGLRATRCPAHRVRAISSTTPAVRVRSRMRSPQAEFGLWLRASSWLGLRGFAPSAGS